jgi:uncharacterized protein
MLNQAIGYSHNFPFTFERVRLDPEMILMDLEGAIRFTRTPQGLLSQVKVRAKIASECGRCLTECTQPLGVDFAELYAFTKRSVTDAGLILPEDGHVDLEPLIREYMLLEIPINPLCRYDCKGLCSICGSNLNETTCSHDDSTIDPRLSSLKSLLDNNQ